MDLRNGAIAGLTLAVLVLGGLLAAERGWLEEPPPPPEPTPDLEAIRVLDVVLDHQQRRTIDIFFERPIARDRVGEMPARPPAEIEPATGGIWRWQGDNILRFEASDRLEPATRYRIRLLPERFLDERQAFASQDEYEVVTDAFQIDRAMIHEEPLPEGGGRVRLRGTLFFNYPVDPRELLPRLSLRDPTRDEPVEIQLETRYRSQSPSFSTAPLQKGVAERELVLSVAPSLTSADGNVPLPAEFVERIPLGSRNRLSIRSVSSVPGERESVVRIELSSPLDPETAAGAIRVEPGLDFSLARDRNALLLRGTFAPETRYRLTVAAGLTAIDGSRLPEEWSSDVGLAALPPSVDFASPGMFLSATGHRRVAIESVNVAKIDLTIERVYRNNVLFLFENERYLVWNDRPGYGGLRRLYGDRIASETLSLDQTRNATITTPLALDDYLGEAEPGLYRVLVGPAGQPYERRQRWILISDLGLVAKTARDEVLVWASSFADLSPAAGARITILSDQNQILHRGRTDARGLLHARKLGPALEGKRIGLIIAEHRGDWSFLPGRQTRVDTAGFDTGGASEATSGYEAFLYGERDLVRPGERLRGIALVRDRTLAAPKSMPLRLVHFDARGEERRSIQIEADTEGVAEFDLEIADYERTGAHRLELHVGKTVVGSHRFQVEEFVPDRIAVEIEPTPGDGIRFDVTSAYLFGPPAAKLPVEARVRLESATFAPEGFASFSFTNPDRTFDRRDLLEEKIALDDAGRARFEAKLPEGLAPPSSLAAVITARVQEQGGRGVAARRRVTVHPFPYYVGLRRLAEGYLDPGEPAGFEFVAVSKEGDEVASGSLRAALYRDRWNTVLRRTARGTYRYESSREAELIEEQPIQAGASRGSFRFTPSEYGQYRVVLTDPETQASAQVSFYASGWGYAPWALEDPSRIELDLDRAHYRAGETAEVQVRAPFPGTLLLTIEGDGVLSKSVHRLEGNTATIELPILPAYRPNVHVSAILVRGVADLEKGSVARAFGAVPLEVDREVHRIPIELSLPEEVRPEGSLRIEALARPGAVVTFAAVDEGILQLIAQDTPNPFDFFYRRRALGVETFDIFSLLLPEVDLERAVVGGGRAKLARTEIVRTEGIRRVEPVSFWSGPVRADARGRAVVEFELPEFQGALRVMAVASRGQDFGSGEGFVRVRDPIVLLPTWPRFVGVEDVFRLPVSVRNDLGQDAEIALRLEASGPLAPVPEAARRVSLPVPNGRERTHYFELETTRGDAPVELTLHAAAAGETTRSRVSLGRPRPDLPRTTLELAGPIEPSTPPVSLAASLRPEHMQRTLRVSRFPLVAYAGKLSSLIRYPYGCLEQTVSRAFPLVYMGALAQEIEPSLFERHDPDAMVDLAIQRVVSHALPQGGFGLWLRADAPNPWASVYATHFLIEAARAGHAVPRPALERALEFVAGEAAARSGLSAAARERAAYALYVLSRADRPDIASMDFFRERERGQLRPASRALIAAAYAAAGHEASVRTLLEGTVGVAGPNARDTGGNFGSPLRSRSLVLLALLESAPDDPRIDELAREIAQDAGELSHWTTQESAFALLALGQLFERERTRPAASGRVRVGTQEVARFSGDTLQLDSLPDGPVSFELDPGTESGAAYYSLRARGVPRDERFSPEANGLEIERTMLGPDGRDALSGFVQGDLVRIGLRIRATRSRTDNVVIESLLPAGFEIENPRLATTEGERLTATNIDFRDDRALVFVDLRDQDWHEFGFLARAVLPGRFRLPPVQAEAMYDPTRRAVGPRGQVEIRMAP